MTYKKTSQIKKGWKFSKSRTFQHTTRFNKKYVVPKKPKKKDDEKKKRKPRKDKGKKRGKYKPRYPVPNVKNLPMGKKEKGHWERTDKRSSYKYKEALAFAGALANIGKFL